MKQLRKILMMSLSVILLAGCSEDELTEKSLTDNSTSEPAQATGSVKRASKDASVLRGTLAAGGGEGWYESDSVWIYTLSSMKHNSYLLTQGAGSANALFTRTGGTDNYEDSGTLYALTSPKYLYGFSSLGQSGAKVSVTIPKSYEISEVGAPEGCSRMPLPYWAIANFAEDGKLEATFKAMTSIMKIDISKLPSDTRAIVLTTHSYTYLGDLDLDAGAEEPLSGTFDTEMVEGAKLTTNPMIFNTYDTLRVNLTTDEAAGQYRHVYLPVVCASYSNLHVIAVTGDQAFPYAWEGKLLKTFKSNTPFQLNAIVAVEPESTGIRTPRM